MKIEILSLGIVRLPDSPAIHYPPGVYDVTAEAEAQLRAQGVLAGAAEANGVRDDIPPPGSDAPPSTDDETSPRKSKGA